MDGADVVRLQYRVDIVTLIIQLFLVEGCHDGVLGLGVGESQGMAALVDGHRQQISEFVPKFSEFMAKEFAAIGNNVLILAASMNTQFSDSSKCNIPLGGIVACARTPPSEGRKCQMYKRTAI